MLTSLSLRSGATCRKLKTINPAIKKVIASIVSAQELPHALTIMPPTAAPIIIAPFWIKF